MALKRGLNKGKGLAALIDTESVKDNGKTSGTNDGVLMLNISQVQPNKNQPRKNFNEDELQELAESIKQHGVISPLLVLITFYQKAVRFTIPCVLIYICLRNI